jgi:hypothetical protein
MNASRQDMRRAIDFSAVREPDGALTNAIIGLLSRRSGPMRTLEGDQTRQRIRHAAYPVAVAAVKKANPEMRRWWWRKLARAYAVKMAREAMAKQATKRRSEVSA